MPNSKEVAWVYLRSPVSACGGFPLGLGGAQGDHELREPSVLPQDRGGPGVGAWASAGFGGIVWELGTHFWVVNLQPRSRGDLQGSPRAECSFGSAPQRIPTGTSGKITRLPPNFNQFSCKAGSFWDVLSRPLASGVVSVYVLRCLW